MANKKTNIRNTQRGIRGLNLVSGYRDLAPGELVEGAEISDVELENAKSTGYFEFGTAAKAEPEAPAPDGAEPLPKNAPKLKKIAKDEGIDVGNATTVEALTAAIEAGRAAKAAGGVPTPTPPTDDLDKMSDPDLRTTVAALTGKPETDYAETSREDLLKLARGQ